MSRARHQDLHRLFSEAVRIPTERRAAFLDAACAGDATLRAEIDAMLCEDAKAEGAFDAACEAGGASFLAAALARYGELGGPPSEHPDRIGRYRILRQLGEGGMGVVYEAEQDDPKRRVALKVVRSSLATSRLIQRFRHEARVLGHLRHPGIAQIYEAGSADSGAGSQPYFAMELVEGETLTKYADRRRLDARARLELLAQLCDILEYAHQKGVIHRDLKPANILVTGELPGTPSWSAGSPQLKVLDFGIARATDADINTVTLQTDVGQLIGTVPYMSPEQASGNPAEIDTRSDVYAVGVIGWELLIGRLPYDIQGKMVHEALRVIREQEASRLSSVDRSLRGDVETIFAKALEKEKGRRYQSAAALATDIRRFLADEPISARPASAMYQFRKFARRNKTFVGGVLSTLLVAIAGAGIATRFAMVAARSAAAAERTSYIAGLGAASGAIADNDFAGAASYLDATPPAHRGWEYDYLRARLIGHLAQWESPPSPVAGAPHFVAPVFEPGGRLMYAVLMNRSMGVWDTRTGRLLQTYPIDSTSVAWWRVTTHAPSMRFAATSADGRIVIRDLRAGHELHSIPAHVGASPRGWSPDGRRLLFTTGSDMQVWEDGTVRVITSEPLGDALFDPAGERIAGAQGTRIAIVDEQSGSVLAQSNIHEAAQLLMTAYSGNGSRIAALQWYVNPSLLDGRTLDVVAHLRGHRGPVTGLTWTTTQPRVVTVADDGMLRIWDGATGAPLAVHPTGMNGPATVGVAPDGATAVVGGSSVRTFPLEDPAVLRGHTSWVYRLAFSPDGNVLATSGADPGIYLWDTTTRRLLRRFPAPRQVISFDSRKGLDAIPLIAFSTDSRRLVATTTSETLQWDVELGEALPLPDVAARSPTDEAARIRLLTTLLGRQLKCAEDAAVSPDGASFARTRGAVVEIFPTDRCAPPDLFGRRAPDDRAVPIAWLEGHAHEVRCVAFSPDGSRIATGGADGTVRIWDARSYEQLLVLTAHQNDVRDVAFSPDGSMLASASDDFTVRLWDTVPLHQRHAEKSD